VSFSSALVTSFVFLALGHFFLTDHVVELHLDIAVLVVLGSSLCRCVGILRESSNFLPSLKLLSLLFDLEQFVVNLDRHLNESVNVIGSVEFDEFRLDFFLEHVLKGCDLDSIIIV